MILSVSRRTDIPYFYHKWFKQRLLDEEISINMPKYNKVLNYHLTPTNIDCIVFWTKDTYNFHECIDLMIEQGHSFYFQFTLTPYGDLFEKNIRPLEDRIAEFKKLSDKIGKEKVIWRYDPIIISNKTDLEYHKQNFKLLANELKGYTNQVVISFLDIYGKLEDRVIQLKKDGILLENIFENPKDLEELSKYMKEIADSCGMKIVSCAEHGLEQYGIAKSACVDGNLINELFGTSVDHKKDKAQREACGCMKSIDVGVYNTCLFDCVYCYANTDNKEKRMSNFKAIDVNSPYLI